MKRLICTENSNEIMLPVIRINLDNKYALKYLIMDVIIPTNTKVNSTAYLDADCSPVKSGDLVEIEWSRIFTHGLIYS